MINKIGRHEVLLPINHNRYNFRKKRKKKLHLGQISPVETVSQAKNSSTLEIPLFLQDFAVVVAVVIVINSIIGGFRRFMIGYFNCPITMSDYNCTQ